MRTNTAATLGAAAFAVGALSSATAQNVYSVNVVGYVNVVVPHGYSIIANPLSSTDNSVNGLFLANSTNAGAYSPVLGDSILLWSGTGFVNGQASNPYGAGAGTSNGGWPNPTFQLPPGTGFYFNNVNAQFTNTFVGTVVQGSTNPVPTGYSLQGSQWPVATNLVQLGLDGGLSNASPTNGAGDTLLTLVNGSFAGFSKNPYAPYTWKAGNALYNNLVDPTNGPFINVGQGFFYQNNQGVALTWAQNFTVQ